MKSQITDISSQSQFNLVFVSEITSIVDVVATLCLKQNSDLISRSLSEPGTVQADRQCSYFQKLNKAVNQIRWRSVFPVILVCADAVMCASMQSY